MRTPLDIPTHLVRDAQLYAPSRDATDAVCHVLHDYPRLVAEARQMRARLADLHREGVELDEHLSRLKVIAEQILEL